MATKLFKLAIDANTTTDVDLHPDIDIYFYEFNPAQIVGDTVTIPATEFTDADGQEVTDTLTTINSNNGYYLLFINGVLQQSSLYTVSGDGSQVVIEDTDILQGAPITLVVTNFVPTATSDTTVNT